MTGSEKIRVAVVGATGYAGAELVRLVAVHPRLELTAVTSERDAGRLLGSVHRSLAFTGLTLQAVDADAIADQADAAFTALPHGTSAPVIAHLIERGLKVVDVGADFRFRDRVLYEKWYGAHGAPDLLAEAVYGLTEFRRAEIGGARLVGNPGCYPVGALMGLLPVAGKIQGPVVVDSKSGTSGAGRAAATEQLFAEVTENVRPYAIGKHRHTPEIQGQLSAASGRSLPVVFSPHLVPLARGILTTCYVTWDGSDPAAVFDGAYRSEPFVRVLGEGVMPEPRNVRGTNLVEIGWVREPSTKMLVVVTAIDNLGKGAAGQAVQNLNCMYGLDETDGLQLLPALP